MNALHTFMALLWGNKWMLIWFCSQFFCFAVQIFNKMKFSKHSSQSIWLDYKWCKNSQRLEKPQKEKFSNNLNVHSIRMCVFLSIQLFQPTQIVLFRCVGEKVCIYFIPNVCVFFQFELIDAKVKGVHLFARPNWNRFYLIDHQHEPRPIKYSTK